MDTNCLIDLVLLLTVRLVKCDILSTFSDHPGYEHFLHDISFTDVTMEVVDDGAVTKQSPIIYSVEVEKQVPYHRVRAPVHLRYEEFISKSFPISLFTPYHPPVEIMAQRPYILRNTVPVNIETPTDKLYSVHIPETHISHPYISHLIKFPLGRPYPVHIAYDKHLTHPDNVIAVKPPYHVVTSKPHPLTEEKRVAVVVNKTVPYPVYVAASDRKKSSSSSHDDTHSSCGCQS